MDKTIPIPFYDISVSDVIYTQTDTNKCIHKMLKFDSNI